MGIAMNKRNDKDFRGAQIAQPPRQARLQALLFGGVALGTVLMATWAGWLKYPNAAGE